MGRKRRERAERVYNNVVIALCIMCMICLTGQMIVARERMQKEQMKIEQHEREFDARMNRIDAGRRNSYEEALLEKAVQWQQSQKGK